MINNSAYIGQEYSYTYEGERHFNKRYYKFYINNDNNEIFCLHNNRVIKLKNIDDLEMLYITEINALVMDKANGNIAYDENNIEISSSVLKERMFPNQQSDYWDFKEE